MIEPGFYPKMSFDEYLEVEALSKSGLVKLPKSPAHYKAPEKPRDQRTLDIGHAFHTSILEPALYRERYAVTDLSLATKDGKEFKKDALAQGQTIIKQPDHDNIMEMTRAVNRHRDASKLVTGGVTEISCFWIDPDYGFLCKLRADKITDAKITVDLKSTGDAEHKSMGFGSFYKSFISLKYYWQAYWYLNGISIASGVPHDDFAFIAVEKEPPWGVNVFFADKELLGWAMEEIEPLKRLYAECLEKDQWPCYEPGPKYIELPNWAKPKEGYYD